MSKGAIESRGDDPLTSGQNATRGEFVDPGPARYGGGRITNKSLRNRSDSCFWSSRPVQEIRDGPRIFLEGFWLEAHRNKNKHDFPSFFRSCLPDHVEGGQHVLANITVLRVQTSSHLGVPEPIQFWTVEGNLVACPKVQ